MKKYLVAELDNGGKLYFVPGGGPLNGVYVNKKTFTPVSIFSFIERRDDISPIMSTNRQKRFWKLKFRDPAWSQKHSTESPPKEGSNPYNRKAALFFEKLEEIKPAIKSSIQKSF